MGEDEPRASSDDGREQNVSVRGQSHGLAFCGLEFGFADGRALCLAPRGKIREDFLFAYSALAKLASDLGAQDAEHLALELYG